MKVLNKFIAILVCLTLFRGISFSQKSEAFTLRLKDAVQSGTLELTENSPMGTFAVQQAPVSSRLKWDIPKTMKAGWYRIDFLATSKYQVIPSTLNELEPFIITIKGPDESMKEAQHSFAYKDTNAKPVTLHSLPQPMLESTQVQTWHGCQPVWIGENSKLEVELRRPLLIIGDINLIAAAGDDHMHLTFTGAADFNMFTDDKPVHFHYDLHNFSDKAVKGSIKFILKDALDGTEQIRTLPVKIKANTVLSDDMNWKPAYGAYLLTAELINNNGNVLCSQHRNLTYSPYIDVKKLPDAWPVGFHFDLGQPETVPPAGFKWIRIWGAWKEMEPEPGRYDWSLMDKHVKFAQENGYRLLWVCHHVPEWSLPDSVLHRPRAFANYPPSDINRMRPFLRDFWKRYDKYGVIGAVEIDNEPNASAGWTPEAYGKEARAIYDVTHQETKDVLVIGISMSGGIPIGYMDRSLKEGLDTLMDIASLHLYEISNPVGEQSIERKTRLFMEKLQEYGLGDMPVWNTESGCPMQMREDDGVIVSQEDLNKQIMQHEEFNPDIPWRVGRGWRAPSELLGVAWMIRASYQQFTMGVQKNFMFQWGGSPHFSWVYDWKQDGNAMPKLIVVGTGVMSKMLLKYGPEPTKEQPEIAPVGSWQVFAHRFEGPEGRMTIVYVNPAQTYAGSGDQVAALAKGDKEHGTSESKNPMSPWLRNQKPEPVRIKVPVNPNLKEVTVTDIFDRDRKNVPVVDGIVEISASEIPQYVLEVKK